MNKTFLKNKHKGFTLMEVMVAVSIFTIVVVVGIGALLTINETYKRSQTDRKAVDSLSYVLESMSRRIRTARTWTTPTGLSSSFQFVDQDGIDVTYQPDGTGGVSLTVVNPGGSLNPALADNFPYTITPVGVDITSAFPGAGLYFNVLQNGATGQKYVQINLGGTVKNARQVSQFMFQTAVSKRTFE